MQKEKQNLAGYRILRDLRDICECDECGRPTDDGIRYKDHVICIHCLAELYIDLEDLGSGE